MRRYLNGRNISPGAIIGRSRARKEQAVTAFLSYTHSNRLRESSTLPILQSSRGTALVNVGKNAPFKPERSQERRFMIVCASSNFKVAAEAF
ncbi:uncharacterized protein FOMMEDRAFT_22512 [Fomitiporia mediterranea MF3/22]|uniref:uncharacterized protein n=1 Tax=Fomitiporia mediterranea (strain MF3/22) TaxID=694068 RepID=UPI0004409621|nr:uncharacterized protein FOMMEDRAFT_22512 [Fomitiporia mediterranea MF3/22]EJD00049.1 hypothetical protein FOMMEDRAFT_22512 [Fomitiporia mediterranea MF3/22]